MRSVAAIPGACYSIRRPNGVSSTLPTPVSDLDFEQVLASLLGAVIVLSADHGIAFVNPAAEAMLHRSRAALLGRPAADLVRIVPCLGDLLARLRATPEATVRDEGRIEPRDGTEGAEVTAIASVLRDRDGRADGTVIVMHDVGSRQWLHQDEQTRAHLAELDGLVSRVAHELNNPLAGIRGAAQMLGGKLSDRPELAKYGEMIVRQADRMSQLIADLLALEPAPATMEPLNIHRVLNDVVLLAQTEAQSRGVDIGLAFDPSLPEIRGSHDQLQQLFLNLLKNAVAACPDAEGRVTVTTRMENRFYVETASERVRYIVVEVADNGAGLDEETHRHMFTPFFSRRKGGTGLGLAIAHNIAVAHKGRIAADNADTGGARLRVTLPVAEARRTAHDPHQ
jgi:two-component system nitrogen regulation sensor histidine kinase GlnL